MLQLLYPPRLSGQPYRFDPLVLQPTQSRQKPPDEPGFPGWFPGLSFLPGLFRRVLVAQTGRALPGFGGTGHRSQGFNFLKDRKLLFFGGLALLYGAFYAFGFQYMSQTFSTAKADEIPTEAAPIGAEAPKITVYMGNCW